MRVIEGSDVPIGTVGTVTKVLENTLQIEFSGYGFRELFKYVVEPCKTKQEIIEEMFSEPCQDTCQSPINTLAEEIHQNAVAHGWYAENRTFGDVIALCHSELSEALEAYRKDDDMFYMEIDKPEGIAVEMVDCVIRIFDYLAGKNVDIERILKLKHEYNKNRPYRHGNKKL
ncbi:MAG: hypothetical protein RBT65_14595 [Methanolobus sp.]|nr:hypothetical protein [Methanolobus sp.]